MAAAQSPQLSPQSTPFKGGITWAPGVRASIEAQYPWPAGTDFIEAPLLSCQRVDYRTLFVHWYDNSESGKSKAERDSSLRKAVEVMDAVPKGCNLRVVVDVQEMSVWFITSSLREWVNKLCESRGWKQIDKCLVVVSSSVMREILTLFPMENRVEFVSSTEEACDKFDVDPDLLL